MNHNRSTIFFLEARKNCRKGDMQCWTEFGCPGSTWPGAPCRPGAMWALQRSSAHPITLARSGAAASPGIPVGAAASRHGGKGLHAPPWGHRGGCRDLSSLSELRVKDLL